MRAAAALLIAAALAGCVGASRERPPPARPQTGGYLVRPGETLSGIAGRLGVDMGALARANGLAPPYVIRVGQRLAVPRNGGAMAGERFESRPVVQPLPRATAAPSPAYLPPAPTSKAAPALAAAPRLTWPADGPLATGFGEGDGRGIAIAAHAGAAVRAAAAGTVLFAGEEPQRYGRLVLVDHGGGWVSAYGHLSRLVVSTGERLRAGARVGFVGAGGAAAQPQLHFELRRDNRPVDPVPLLPPRL